MLVENTLFGVRDKVEIAIDRLRLYEPIALSYSSKGYYVADSGGKDSTVIKYLAELAGVKYEVAHSHTTADHPETVYFVRREQERIQAQGIEYSIEYPHYKGKRTSIWGLIGIKGLPTRTQRWCCTVCKEGGGDGKVVVTGVRWAESNSRKQNRGIAEVQHKKKNKSLILTNDNTSNRRVIENCVKKGKRVVNPIIDWTTDEVWEFIYLYELPYNPLYDKGYKRVGCVGCPNSDNFTELELNPQYKQMYIRAAARYLAYRALRGEQNTTWHTPADYYLWWTEQIRKEAELEGQITFEDQGSGSQVCEEKRRS